MILQDGPSVSEIDVFTDWYHHQGDQFEAFIQCCCALSPVGDAKVLIAHLDTVSTDRRDTKIFRADVELNGERVPLARFHFHLCNNGRRDGGTEYSVSFEYEPLLRFFDGPRS